MTIATPPRPPRSRDLDGHGAELDALIEEARRRARRRRRLYGCVIVAAIGAGAAAIGWGSSLWRSQAGASPAETPPEAGSARSAPAAGPSRIAFMSAAPFASGPLYVMNADGTGKRGLAQSTWEPGAPAWSPDGSRLAFHVRLPTSRRGQCGDCNDEVYVVNSDGSGRQNVTRNPAYDGSPSWAPDGQAIAFSTGRDGNGEIYLMNADGSGQRNLTRDTMQDWGSVWSPDGLKIAFGRVVGGVGNDRNLEIYVMNADGSDQRRLTNHPAPDISPAWSPDGRTIAFISYRDVWTAVKKGGFGRRRQAIYLVNADGSAERRLTRKAKRDDAVTWSPDGRTIAFVDDRTGNDEIFVINADGTGLRNLTRDPGRDGHPVWSPDGRKIGFVSNRGGNRDIYVMDADGGDLQNLTRDIPRQAFGVAWSPARTK